MPLGSSSEAPVIRPGPSLEIRDATFRRGLRGWTLGAAETRASKAFLRCGELSAPPQAAAVRCQAGQRTSVWCEFRTTSLRGWKRIDSCAQRLDRR